MTDETTDTPPHTVMERIEALEKKQAQTEETQLLIQRALTKAFGHGWLRQIEQDRQNADEPETPEERYAAKHADKPE